MNQPEHVPIYYTTPENRQPLKHHHSARYYAHRVKDSLTTRVSKIVCSIFLSILFILGLVAFIMWLSLRPHRPRIHIHDFTLPALAQESGFENAQITFNVTARNSNQHIGFNYGIINGSVYYQSLVIGSTPLVTESFYQEPKNTTVIFGQLSGATLTVTSQSWMQFQNDRSRGVVIFRLYLTTRIQFKVSTWHSHYHTMHANCNCEVGPDGLLLATAKDKRCPVYFT